MEPGFDSFGRIPVLFLFEMMREIEEGAVSTVFFLASDVDWLYRRVAESPAVNILRDAVLDEPDLIPPLVWRTIQLFDKPVAPGFVSDHEVPICCYAFILTELQDDLARWAVDYLDANSTSAHGWLNLLLSRCLKNSSTATLVAGLEDGVTTALIPSEGTSQVTAGGATSGFRNGTAFEALYER
jgi:hypothetical protein